MAGEGKDVTSPTLDVADFIGKSFTTAPDGKMYQLPDQQFANLYWFRYDWFQRPEIKEKFKAKYGYDLGVPVNWSAYEDIAEFFTNDVKEVDGVKVYGHMDYGKKDPSLGWRFTDAWLSMAGNGDKGIPNGLPVDEWGIRMEGCRPVGSSVDRGGDTNGPAAVYSITKYLDWLKKYAPPQAQGMNFSESGPVPAQGNIAQQIFWYTAFTADMVKPGLPVMNADGTPKWRMAPSPHGSYWKDGHEARLPGRGIVDAAEVDSRRPPQGGLALCPVRHLEDGLAEEEPCGPHFHPRKRHLGQEHDRTRAASSAASSSSTARPPACNGRRPATTCPTIRSSRSSGGRTSATRPRARRPRSKRWTRWRQHRTTCSARLERANVQGECGPKLNPKTSAEDWYQESRGCRHDRAAAQARQREAEGRDGGLRHADQELARLAAEAQLTKPGPAPKGRGLFHERPLGSTPAMMREQFRLLVWTLGSWGPHHHMM